MKKGVIIVVLVLALMEGVSWWVYKSFSSKEANEPSQPSEEEQVPVLLPNVVSQQPIEEPKNNPASDGQVSVAPEAFYPVFRQKEWVLVVQKEASHPPVPR